MSIAPPIPRAPEGTKPGTLWFWLLAFTPLIGLVTLIPTSILLSQLAKVNFHSVNQVSELFTSPTYAIISLLGLAQLVVTILFPVLDWHDLERRGVPSPFHWAWAFFALVIGTPLVYVIGRTVVVKRRTGAGLAPLWVYVGLTIVNFLVYSAVVALYLIAFFGTFADALSRAGNVR